MTSDDCPFCKRIEAGEYDRELSPNGLQAVFAPLNPVTPGHLLVVPWEHIESAATDPKVAGAALGYAARIVQHFGYNANIITSVGPDASQTVFHMHVHVIPRRPGDNLRLPWPQDPKCSYCYCLLEDAPECAGGCAHRELAGYAGCSTLAGDPQ